MSGVEVFDLMNEADVQRLATELGEHITKGIVDLVTAMGEEHRGIFFGYLFAAPFGAMGRVLGLENSRAVVEELMKAVQNVQEARKRAAH